MGVHTCEHTTEHTVQHTVLHTVNTRLHGKDWALGVSQGAVRFV